MHAKLQASHTARNSEHLIKPAPRQLRNPAGRFVAFLLVVACGAANASTVYDAGPLAFSTTNQSMWGSGGSTVLEDSVFVGAQWNDKTAKLGDITGTVVRPTVNTNPGWWAWKLCKDTVNFLCGGEPDPKPRTVTIDTRNGAEAILKSSGKFGLEFGYTIDSGSVDAMADFTAMATLPSSKQGAGEYFSLDPVSSLTAGSLSSQSPRAEAYINAIAQLSGSVSGQACLIGFGCTAKGTANLPNLDANQPILSIDPNNLNIVPDLLPPANPGGDRRPLAQANLLNQTVTLQGALSATGVPGFKATSNFGDLFSTIPPGPAATVDLASIAFKLPDISTNGGLQGGTIQSSGRDDVIQAKIDLDGVATMAGFPPLGIGLDLLSSGGFKIGAQFDALDIDAGPDIGITQDFELTPTLMARLDFDKPVHIEGFNGLQSFWEGAWDMMPDIALLQTTTINPTFWLDALLTNTLGIDLGLSGTLDILKFSAGASYNGVSILGTTPISLNQLLGLGNELFSTPKLEIPVYSLPFALQGFDPIQTAAFTIQVPVPGTVVIILIGLVAVGAVRRRQGRLSPIEVLVA